MFVPASHTTWFQDPPAIDRPLYRMPPVAMFATFIAAVPLGIARHAIDEFINLADNKTPLLSASMLADKPVAQDRLGRAHALVTAGRHFLSGTLDDLWVRVQAGHQPTMADRGGLWLAATHAAHSALDAIGLLYTAAGASSIYTSSPLDRCLRDARTAVQHICTQTVTSSSPAASCSDGTTRPAPGPSTTALRPPSEAQSMPTSRYSTRICKGPFSAPATSTTTS